MARPSHLHFMEQALELAKKGRCCVSPNPMVGAVIAHYGKVVAEGYHAYAGGDHAEVAALKKLDPKYVEGATLYVTLEPCNHVGRTPPCTEAIIASGIKRVVVGARDPNPKVNGAGVARLKESGIEVIEQVMHQTCTQLNVAYNKYITTGLPYVLLKVALTLDGKIATSKGESKWITNPQSRLYVHQLRENADAILIGGNTLRRDDPLLTVRLKKRSKELQPAVLIVDETLELPQTRRLYEEKKRRLIFATSFRANPEQKERLEEMGHTVWAIESDVTGRADVKELLQRLGAEKITSVLLEGGGGIYAMFMESRQVDKIAAMVAPKMVGGQGVDWLPNFGIPKLKDALQLQNVEMQIFGDNVLMEGTLE